MIKLTHLNCKLFAFFFLQAPDNQKFGVCEALLMVGGWDQARSVLERLPQFAAVSHPPISKALCKLIHTTIEPLYRRLVLTYCFILFYFFLICHTHKKITNNIIMIK